MGGADLRQIGTQIEPEKLCQLLRMPISCRSVVTMIDPEHWYFLPRLHGEMQHNGFVGSEIRRNNCLACSFGDGPLHYFQRVFFAKLGVPLRYLFRIHGVLN